MKSLLLRVFLILAISFFFIVSSDIQVFCQTGYLNIGKLSTSIHQDPIWGTLAGSSYPNGTYRRSVGGQSNKNFIFKQFTYEEGTEIDLLSTGTAGIIQPLIEWRRWAYPEIIVDGTDVSTFNTYVQTNSNLVSDIMVESHDENWGVGMSYDQKIYAYANEFHGDYYINAKTVTFTLKSDPEAIIPLQEQTVDMFYVNGYRFTGGSQEGILSTVQYADYGYWDVAWHACRDFPSPFMAAGVIPARDRTHLTISYSYDADFDWVTDPPELSGTGYPTFDDMGNPDMVTGEFLSPGYMGIATLHADKSVDDTSDDPSKPVSGGQLWVGVNIWPNDWGQPFYEYCSTPRRMKEQFIETGAISPKTATGPGVHMPAFGPYIMDKDDDFSFVEAVGVGSIDRQEALDEGAIWLEHYKAGDANMAEWDQRKNDVVGKGLDLLIGNLDRAYWNFTVRDLDIPDPPPTPNVTVTSGPDMNIIEWSYPNSNMFLDPDHGTNDFKEWRVYRKLGSFLEDDFKDGSVWYKYELIASLPQNTLKYEDGNVTNGKGYHYCVTGVDDGSFNDGLFPGTPLEGSYYENRTKLEAVSFKGGANTSEEVAIVPNPYSLSTGPTNAMNFEGRPSEIIFMNIPPICDLKIYTATGDLVQEFEHRDLSDQERWKQLRTMSNQRPVSGVYILVVTNAKDHNNVPLPKKFYKFVIVR